MAVGNGLPDRKTQTVALIRKQGGQVEIVDDYPIPSPGANEVLVKILYTGVCQSGELLRITMLIIESTPLTKLAPNI